MYRVLFAVVVLTLEGLLAWRVFDWLYVRNEDLFESLAVALAIVWLINTALIALIPEEKEQ